MTPDELAQQQTRTDPRILAFCAETGRTPDELAAILAETYRRAAREISVNFAALVRRARDTAERIDALVTAAGLSNRPAQQTRPLRHRRRLRMEP